MPRTCVLTLIGWIVLAAVYGWYVREMPGAVPFVVAAGMASLVGLGILMVIGARYELRDWRARNRAARGERPEDGQFVAVIGEIRPLFEPLIAPLTGRECVAYRYDVGISKEAPIARDYTGFGMTRCSVYTSHGPVSLGSFPVLHGFAELRGDGSMMKDYVASATFEPIQTLGDAVKRTAGMFIEAKPPLRKDWRLALAPPPLDGVESREVCVPSRAMVTAYGRFSSSTHALVAGTEAQGHLRLVDGGVPHRAAGVPMRTIAQLCSGAVLIAVAHLILWIVLTKIASL
jgi:hypothetical protein